MLTALHPEQRERNGTVAGLVLGCPHCGAGVDRVASSTELAFACGACEFSIPLQNGIWRALPPERAKHFSSFIRDYERIRAAEGRGSQEAHYYLGLPYKDRSGHNTAQWKIRARTFAYLTKYILPRNIGAGGRILDIGAGNGWLSYRLALLGLRPAAVDLLSNDHDGLGAARHYVCRLPESFPRFQAESAALPFASGQFEAVIFNASFHYAENYRDTMAEALRCLKQSGVIIIADTPWYSVELAGERMVAERREAFLRQYGTPSDSIHSQEYLTDARLRELEQDLDIRWEQHAPFYGIRWSLRPVIARLRQRREPASFRIYVARRAR
jgi:SAM-dependent methyltransferase